MTLPRVGRFNGRSVAALTRTLRADPGLRREAIRLLRSDLLRFLEQCFTLNAAQRATFAASVSKSNAEDMARFYIRALENPAVKVSFRSTRGATPRLTYTFTTTVARKKGPRSLQKEEEAEEKAGCLVEFRERTKL